ncbi:GAF domain-containing protein [bacterium]|nr:GAF domain-containing protein [bacterium]
MKTNSSIPLASRSTEVARLTLAQIPPETPLSDIFGQACEICAETLEVERAGIWLFIDDRTVLRCVNLYERSKKTHSSGFVLRVEDFPTYFASLSLRKALPAEIAVHEPWTSELAETYMQPLGISSMLDAGIFVESKLVGVVCHEHVGQNREWTTEDRDFAGSVADLLALRIQSAKVRELQDAFQTQQDRLASLEKEAALSQLAAAVSHDFQNLLAIFLGRGELISQSDASPDVKKQAQVIVDTAKRGNDLVKQLLDFAKPVKHHPSVIDLDQTAHEFMPVMQSAVGSHHTLQCDSTGALGKVLIDKNQFTRLLLNIVINARDAMPQGGKIDIRLSTVELTYDQGYSGRFVQLEVSDKGIGIDEKTKQRIFEPFFTTKTQGTGLGLAIVRQIVERTGGFIRVDSHPGLGTTFRMFFPNIEASTGEAPVLILSPEPGMKTAI